VAITVRDIDIVTWHVGADPLQAPLHPAKVDPEAGVAVSVTSVETE
jgi:hypothetical protein